MKQIAAPVPTEPMIFKQDGLKRSPEAAAADRARHAQGIGEPPKPKSYNPYSELME